MLLNILYIPPIPVKEVIGYLALEVSTRPWCKQQSFPASLKRQKGAAADGQGLMAECLLSWTTRRESRARIHTRDLNLPSL